MCCFKWFCSSFFSFYYPFFTRVDSPKASNSIRQIESTIESHDLFILVFLLFSVSLSISKRFSFYSLLCLEFFFARYFIFFSSFYFRFKRRTNINGRYYSYRKPSPLCVCTRLLQFCVLVKRAGGCVCVLFCAQQNQLIRL